MSIFDILKTDKISSTLQSLAGSGGSLTSSLSSTLQNVAGKAKEQAQSVAKNAPQGVPGLLGAGALGALLGSVLSSDTLKNVALVGAGAVAWNFYQKWSNKDPQQAGQQAQANAAAAAGSMPQCFGAFGNAGQQETLPEPADATAMLMFRAMIYAARADGHIDPDEQSRLSKVAAQLFPGQDTSAIFNSILSEPLDPSRLAAKIVAPEQGEDLYRLSCLVLEIDHFMERSYLDALARAMHIDDARKLALEQESVAARKQLEAM